MSLAEFENYKSAGNALVEANKIDKKEYYRKVRQKGIELGIYGADEYPDLLPKGVKTTMQVVGGVVGGIAGSFGSPVVGTSIGAGVGSGTATALADKLGGYLNPDLPRPDNDEVVADAIAVGTIDGLLTVGTFGVGKALKLATDPARKMLGRGKDLAAKKVDDAKKLATEQGAVVDDNLTMLSRAAQPPQRKKEALQFLRDEVQPTIGRNVEVPIGVTTGIKVLEAMFNLTSRMPFMIGRKKILDLYEALEDYTATVFNPKQLTVEQRSKAIKDASVKYVEDMETAANDLYKSGWDKLEKETFDNTGVQNTISKHFSREVTKETKEKTGQIILSPRQVKDTFKVTESQSQSAKEFVEMPNKLTDYVNKIFARDKLSGEDLKEILEELTVQANRYDPYPSKKGIQTALDSGNRRAYEAIKDIKKSVKDTIYNSGKDGATELADGDRKFTKLMNLMNTKNIKLIESKVGQLRNLSGYKKHYEQYGDTVAQDFFEKGTSVQQLRELKKTIGKDDFNDIASGHIDDILKKHLTFDADEPSVNMAALKQELGLTNKNSLKYARTKEMISGFDNMTMERFEGFLNMIQQFPSAIPDLNQFIMRSGTLRLASGATGAALIGSSAFTGGVSGMVGFGTLYLANYLLSQPSLKKIASLAATSGSKGTQYQTILKNKFLNLIRRVNNLYKDLPQGQGSLAAFSQTATVPTAQAITDNQE